MIRLRYIELEGRLRKILVVVKMRGGDHSKDIREYEITSEGLVLGARLTDYRGLITGVPHAKGELWPEMWARAGEAPRHPDDQGAPTR
jgi:hypothetical protein